MLRESLKNSVPLPELAAKLSERDAQHDQATRDLRVQAHRAEGLQEEVDRLKGREEELKASHRAKLDRLREAHQKENEGHLRRFSKVVEEHEKLTKDYQRQSDVLAAKEKRLVDEVRRLDGVMAGKFLPALLL